MASTLPFPSLSAAKGRLRKRRKSRARAQVVDATPLHSARLREPGTGRRTAGWPCVTCRPWGAAPGTHWWARLQAAVQEPSWRCAGAKLEVRTSSSATRCPRPHGQTSSGGQRPLNVQGHRQEVPPAPAQGRGDGARLPAPKPHFPSPALPPCVPERPAKDRLDMAYHRL